MTLNRKLFGATFLRKNEHSNVFKISLSFLWFVHFSYITFVSHSDWQWLVCFVLNLVAPAHVRSSLTPVLEWFHGGFCSFFLGLHGTVLIRAVLVESLAEKVEKHVDREFLVKKEVLYLGWYFQQLLISIITQYKSWIFCL